MAVKKVILNGSTIMTVEDTTAVESDVAQGKTFYKSNGDKAVGIAEASQGNNTVDGWFIEYVQTGDTCFKIDWSNYALESEIRGSVISNMLNHIDDMKKHGEVGLIFQGVFTNKYVYVSNNVLSSNASVEEWYDRLGHQTSTEYIEDRVSQIKIMDSSEQNEVEVDTSKYYTLKPEPDIDEDATAAYKEQLINLGFSANDVEKVHAWIVTFIEVHIHNWGEWEVVREPDDKMPGLKMRTCSICGEQQTMEFKD